MPRPTLYQQAKRLRLERGFSQQEVASKYGKSQSWIAALEKGAYSREQERAYLDWLEERRTTNKRHPGGEQKIGPLRVRRSENERTVRPADVRGTPLDETFDYAATMPADTDWKILAIARSAKDVEIGFLQDPTRDLFGIVGFHLIKGVVQRGRIIAFDAEYDELASQALVAFANSEFDEGGDEVDDITDVTDDGILAGDED